MKISRAEKRKNKIKLGFCGANGCRNLIDTIRSKSSCTSCLDLSRAKTSIQRKTSIKNGKCGSCKTKPINFERSDSRCTICLDKVRATGDTRVNEGKCRVSGCKERLLTQVLCEKHLNKEAETGKELRQKRNAAGICAYGDSILSLRSNILCDEHLVTSNIYSKEWVKANPEVRRERSAARKAIKLRTKTASVSYKEILKEEKYTCHLCNKQIDIHLSWLDPYGLHMDHVIPLSKGGTHTKENIKPSHASCNLKKGAKLL